VVDTTSPPDDFVGSDYVISAAPELDMDERDIFTLGIEKEDASFRLYVNLIALAKDLDSKEILMALAEEELRHKIRFETELDKLSEKQ